MTSALTADQRQFLAARINAARSAPARTIPRLGDDSTIVASFAQERLWLINRLSRHDHAYNVYHALHLCGRLDRVALRRALDGLAERHETLRTVLRPGKGTPVQQVLPAGPVELREQEVTLAEREQAIEDACREPFDLAAGPVLRARLIRAGAEDHVLVLAMPHVATDGWSTTVLARDLAALYGGGELPAPAAVRYRDYAAWQRDRLSGDVLRAELDHWRTALTGQPHTLDLPTDHSRPSVQQLAGADHRTEIPPAVTAAVRELADRHDVSLYMVLITAVRVLLQAHTGQDRFILASTIAGRDRPELEDVVGCFINTLALRGDLSGDPSFAAALSVERSTLLDAFAHQSLPFDLLVRDQVSGRDTARSPLAQVFVQLDRGTEEGWRLPGLDVREIKVPGDVAKFDLSFFFRDAGDRLHLNLEYATALFEPDTAARMAERLVQLLVSATAAPQAPLSTVALLPAEEHRTLAGFNDTTVPVRFGEVTEVLAQRAATAGDRQAVQFGTCTLTYAQLDARVNQLAHYLRGRGVGRGDLVAVFLNRGEQLPVALLAVLRTGAGYVPLNPGEPAERVALILQDADPALVLTERDLAPHLPGAISTVHLDECQDEIADQRTDNPAVPVDPADLAYVIFTSGSTGRPKGVAVPRSALTNFLSSMSHRPGMTDGDVLVAVTTPSFDIAALEMFLPIFTGGRLVIASKRDTLDSGRLRNLIATSGATVIQATPATWRLLAGATELARVKALVGGEALTADVAGPLVASTAEVWNMYGPTETTIWSTVRRITAADADRPGPLPIGTPIDNTTCHILDAFGRAAPIGVPGELLIGGSGVANGYFAKAGLSAQRFVADPFNPDGQRLYRTGDLARYRADGDIEFLGRHDHQVKIRGFRIEVGEIETHLSAYPGVEQSVVTAHEFGPGDTRLVAYVTVAQEPPTAEQMRSHLAGKVPDYMIPGTFEVLDAFPLTPNRKVDRKALPAPAARAVASGAEQAPRTALEHLVADVWADVLGAPVPGVHSDFFALGGHSLLAVEVMNRLNRDRGTAVPATAILDAPTVAGLAARLDVVGDRPAPTAIARVDRAGMLRPAPAQERLWFLEQLTPGTAEYHIPVELRLDGPVDVEALSRAGLAIVHRHEALRTRLRTGADGELTAVVEPAGSFPVDIDDACGDSRRADELATAESIKPFDLTHDDLLRARLIRLTAERHVLVLTLHHIAGDGASLDILREELATAYAAARLGGQPDLGVPAIGYPDVAAWQNRNDDDARRADLAYWQRRLAGLAPLDLPIDRPRPVVRDPAAAAHRFRLPAEVAARLDQVARMTSTTPFVVLLAAYQATLGRWAGTDDIAVSTAVADRDHPQTHNLIGMFVNTVVLRADLRGDPGFTALVTQARSRVAEALAHQHAPFDRVVAAAYPSRDPSRIPLTPAHFTLQSGADTPWQLEGLSVRRRRERIVATRHELALGLARDDDGYQGILEYVPALFDAASIAAFAELFTKLVLAVCTDPQHRPGPFAAAPAAGTRPQGASSPGRVPLGAAEKAVAEIWANVLGSPVTDADADFFALGGHSLLAARVRLQIQAALGVDLPMHLLFAATTVATLAEAVERAIDDDLSALNKDELASLEAGA